MLFLFFFVLFSVFLPFVGAKVLTFFKLAKVCGTNTIIGLLIFDANFLVYRKIFK